MGSLWMNSSSSEVSQLNVNRHKKFGENSSWMNSSSSEVSQFNGNHHKKFGQNFVKPFLETKVHITIEGETEPYLIKIPKHIDNICLSDLKAKMPTKGDYRYYFKTIDSCGAPYNEEIIYDSIKLPSFEGKISVK